MLHLNPSRGFFLVFGLASLAMFSACGGSSAPPPPPPPPPLSVGIHPNGASVLSGTQQQQQFSATVANDSKNQGVTWSADGVAGGNASTGTITSSGLYTPPVAAGTHTVTATSVTDTSKSASATVGITDLAGVATYHNDLARDGVNQQEYALAPANVNKKTFGKLFACAVDGAAYTQPLWAPALTIGSAVHNVIFVATQHDSLYAFEADASPCITLWQANLLDATHGGVSGETPVPWNHIGSGAQDITPEIGVTGTPVMDLSTKTIYVVSKSETAGPIFHQRLHAIDLATGNEKFGAPVNISASVPGSGDGSSGGTLSFNLQSQNFRSALSLSNGVVYICWASHEDAFPYHGWIIGYNAANVQQQIGVYNSTPNGGLGGIWMGGAAPAIDANGNLFVSTGNGTFDANQAGPPNTDYGDSLLKISGSGLNLLDFFTPFNQSSLNQVDADLGSGAVTLLPDQPSGPKLHLLVSGGKEGVLYLIDRDNMGHFNSISNGQIVQSWSADNGLFGTVAFWQNTLFVAGAVQGNRDNLKSYSFNSAGGQFTTTPGSTTAHSFPFPGATPSVSSAGASNGIVWAVDSSAYGVPSPFGAGPAILFAFNASNLSSELWDSSQAGGARDQAGNAVKFVVPTVANGKVYVGTRTEVDVYGLLP